MTKTIKNGELVNALMEEILSDKDLKELCENERSIEVLLIKVVCDIEKRLLGAVPTLDDLKQFE